MYIEYKRSNLYGSNKKLWFYREKYFWILYRGRGRSGQTVLAINLINIKIFSYKVTYN